MTKLEKLYASIKGLQDLGLPLNQETLKAADELEEQLIKEEILPAMSQDIEPLLSKIQRELVLVVEYKPGSPISVALSRKTNISEIINAKKLEIDPEVSHREGIRQTALPFMRKMQLLLLQKLSSKLVFSMFALLV